MSIKFSFNRQNSSRDNVVFLVYGGKMYGVGIIENDLIKVKKVFETL